MKLTAEHFDGFSELLLGWKVSIRDNVGNVDAKWFSPSGRRKATFALPFDSIDLAAVGISLSELLPRYDGGVDDFPHHILQFTDGDDDITVCVSAGIKWPPDVQADIDTFYRIWKPIAQAVESHAEMPRRS